MWITRPWLLREYINYLDAGEQITWYLLWTNSMTIYCFVEERVSCVYNLYNRSSCASDCELTDQFMTKARIWSWVYMGIKDYEYEWNHTCTHIHIHASIHTYLQRRESPELIVSNRINHGCNIFFFSPHMKSMIEIHDGVFFFLEHPSLQCKQACQRLGSLHFCEYTYTQCNAVSNSAI